MCKQNVDPRLHGKNATCYGKGSYFARDASYSNSYAGPDQGQYHMFLARVLVGKYTTGDSSMRRPPPLTPDSDDLFDSCVDNVKNPSIFVVFERDQCYPSYKIIYAKK